MKPRRYDPDYRYLHRRFRRHHRSDRHQMPQVHGGCIFCGLLTVFGLLTMLLVGGISVASALVGLLLGGNNPFGDFIPVVCCLAMALPIFAAMIGAGTYRSVAQPLSDLINAAEAVADGNFTVRVSETAPFNIGEFSQTFNRMVAEIERIDEQRRNLTADVAHELRTPLHIIQGNLEGILDGVYDPTPDHINSILDDTRLLSRLIEDLRTLSMAESGQLHLDMEPISVQDLLSDAVTSFSGHADSEGIKLMVANNEQTGDLAINADLRRLNQILGNLIINAIRHTPSGGTISLSAAPHDESVQLTISDTGQGIAPDDLPHIFDRFWRGDKSRTHKDGVGGGLGLAITQQLVNLHAGSIVVESTVGQGTTFRLDLPLSSDSSKSVQLSPDFDV